MAGAGASMVLHGAEVWYGMVHRRHVYGMMQVLFVAIRDHGGMACMVGIISYQPYRLVLTDVLGNFCMALVWKLVNFLKVTSH